MIFVICDETNVYVYTIYNSFYENAFPTNEQTKLIAFSLVISCQGKSKSSDNDLTNTIPIQQNIANCQKHDSNWKNKLSQFLAILILFHFSAVTS